MIYTWCLKNFKSVKGKKELDFAPLTIFAGANSSGKSTIIQSILLTCQTLQNSVSNKSIILNGHISRFGTFNDILSNGVDDRIIEIGFSFLPIEEQFDSENIIYPRYFGRYSDNVKYINCEFAFTDTINNKSSDILQLQPKLERSLIKTEFINDKPIEIEVARSTKRIQSKVEELKLKETTVQKNELSSLEYDVLKSPLYPSRTYTAERNLERRKYVGADLSHFLPKVLTIAYDKIESGKTQFIECLLKFEYFPNAEEVFNSYINDSIKQKILKFGDDTLNEMSEQQIKTHDRGRFFKHYLDRLKKDFTYNNYRSTVRTSIFGKSFLQKVEEGENHIRNLIKTEVKEDFRLTSTFDFYHLSENVEEFFKRNVKYLGPLRDEPKPVYPLSSSSDPRDIGFKGENTAAVLEVHRNTFINYISPRHFDNKLENLNTESTSLINAVLEWLDYMGVASKVDTSDKGKLGHELKISTLGSSSLHDLTHVGVGVSQVLPILVLSLLADPGSTLIFEQPELHLHPKVQSRLADFFVSLTLLKKQCLVETHSEYLINRLRFQVAISKGDEISKDITMYFVEKDEHSSQYRKVLINKYGVIDDWPSGFFDENEENASKILKAGMEKRRIELKK